MLFRKLVRLMGPDAGSAATSQLCATCIFARASEGRHSILKHKLKSIGTATCERGDCRSQYV